MHLHSRVVFYLKGNESNLIEAMVGSERDVVKISYIQNGVPYYRSFLYETAQRHFDSGNWIVVSYHSLTA